MNYAKEGDTVIQGQDAGFIKFGSRVDIFIPLDSAVKININEITTGAETILASSNKS